MRTNQAKLAVEIETARLLMANSTLKALSQEYRHSPSALKRILEVAKYVEVSASRLAKTRQRISEPIVIDYVSEFYEIEEVES